MSISHPCLADARFLRYETGKATSEYPSSAKAHYRQQYFEAFVMTASCIKGRFDQPGYQVYRQLQDMVLKRMFADQSDVEEMGKVADLYKGDFNMTSLETQLQALRVHLTEKSANAKKGFTINDDVASLRDMTPASRTMFSEVFLVLKFILVMPATIATSERSFSALRRVKTHLRSTMSQEQLNHLMLLHVHNDATDALNLCTVANDFVSAKESRVSIFGQF